MTKNKRGFAAMDSDKQKAIASSGGKAKRSISSTTGTTGLTGAAKRGTSGSGH